MLFLKQYSSDTEKKVAEQLLSQQEKENILNQISAVDLSNKESAKQQILDMIKNKAQLSGEQEQEIANLIDTEATNGKISPETNTKIIAIVAKKTATTSPRQTKTEKETNVKIETKQEQIDIKKINTEGMNDRQKELLNQMIEKKKQEPIKLKIF